MNATRQLPRTLTGALSFRWSTQPTAKAKYGTPQWFSTTRLAFQRSREDQYDAKARKLNQQSLDEHEQEVKVRQHQVQRPWHRHDADKPPVDDKGNEFEEPLTKGTDTLSSRSQSSS